MVKFFRVFMSVVSVTVSQSVFACTPPGDNGVYPNTISTSAILEKKMFMPDCTYHDLPWWEWSFFGWPLFILLPAIVIIIALVSLVVFIARRRKS